MVSCLRIFYSHQPVQAALYPTRCTQTTRPRGAVGSRKGAQRSAPPARWPRWGFGSAARRRHQPNGGGTTPPVRRPPMRFPPGPAHALPKPSFWAGIPQRSADIIGTTYTPPSSNPEPERIRTRKNRPRIQGANFRWGLPIRDGDTFYFWPPRAPTLVKKREAPAPARWWRGAVKRAAGVSEALRGPPSTKQYVAGLRRQVPLQEGARPVDGTGLQLRRILPGKHRDLGVRRQRGDVDRNLERMRRHVVGQHQHWGLARLREVARHAVHEIGPHAVEAVQVFLERFHRHVGPALAELLGPDVAPGVEHVVRLLRPVPDRLAQQRGDDALRRALHQFHRERAADAIAEEKELTDAEMVHQAELVVGERAPGIVDRHRAGGLAARGVTLVHGDDAEVVLELLRDVDHRVRPDRDARVQAAAGRRQQRKPRADLGVADADIALLVEADLGALGQSRDGRCRLRLSKHLRHGGCCSGGSTGCKNGASA